MSNSKSYNNIYKARFIIEAASPLAVGSGEKGIVVDRLIARDANGLPYIPGTSILGIIRHQMEDKNTDEALLESLKDAFGQSGAKEGMGSRIVFSDAQLSDTKGETAVEKINGAYLAGESEGYYSWFNRLPNRDHVRMTDKAAADTDGHGKFDEELVHKGSRFIFTICLNGNEDDTSIWNSILGYIHSPFFRIGAGTRNGFGQIKVISCKVRCFQLDDEQELMAWLKHSNSLNDKAYTSWQEYTADRAIADSLNDQYQHYTLRLKPSDFFLFGAGYGDEDGDSISKTEHFIQWEDNKDAAMSNVQFLIPGSSIKGALAHRTAFHYNKSQNHYIRQYLRSFKSEDFKLKKETFEEELKSNSGLQNLFNGSLFDAGPVIKEIENAGSEDLNKVKSQRKIFEDFMETEIKKQETLIEEAFKSQIIYESIVWNEFIDQLEILKKLNHPTPVGENNEAVKILFGFAKGEQEEGQRGHVLIEDIYVPAKVCTEKVFTHVKIDRFTGGTIDGALFQEKVVRFEKEIDIDIYVDKAALQDEAVKQAFEQAMEDVKTGALPLGGQSSKGHGIFEGELFIH
jgi:CRISPR/Cas system CSM-associated protein Csm3 (group 7 of RAMP superfamily)